MDHVELLGFAGSTQPTALAMSQLLCRIITNQAKEVNTRFSRKLGEQIRFIRRSSNAFDQGAEEEALRIAVCLRVVFHDTRRSVSILNHLGLQNGKMLSSARGHGDWKDYLGHKIDLTSSTPITMVPLLNNQFLETELANWWDTESIFVHDGQGFTRRKIILSIANKDGGAHVDEQLESYYETLCAGEYAIGITGNLDYECAPPFSQGVTQYPENAHLALVRQFAHETLASAQHYGWPAI